MFFTTAYVILIILCIVAEADVFYLPHKSPIVYQKCILEVVKKKNTLPVISNMIMHVACSPDSL